MGNEVRSTSMSLNITMRILTNHLYYRDIDEHDQKAAEAKAKAGQN